MPAVALVGGPSSEPDPSPAATHTPPIGRRVQDGDCIETMIAAGVDLALGPIDY
jgi:hypothetical protein